MGSRGRDTRAAAFGPAVGDDAAHCRRVARPLNHLAVSRKYFQLSRSQDGILGKTVWTAWASRGECPLMSSDWPTKEEAERRAREVAQRMLTKPKAEERNPTKARQ